MLDKDVVRLLPTIQVGIGAPGPHDTQRTYVISASARAPDGRRVATVDMVTEYDFEASQDPAALLGAKVGVAVTELLRASDKLTKRQETQNV